jgi:hypothetical protein
MVAALGLLTALFVLVPTSPASSGPTRSITIEKIVDGDGPDGPYDINVSCTNTVDPVQEFDLSLNDGENDTVVVTLANAPLFQAITCTVTEPGDQSANSTAFECTIPGGSAATCPSTDQVAWSGANVGAADVTVTNVFGGAGALEFVNVSGNIKFGDFDALDIPEGDAGFTLEWDTTTGDVTGTSSFGSTLISQAAAPPDVPTDVCVKSTIFNDPASGNTIGTIDPDTGEVEFTSTNGVTFVIWAGVLCPSDGSEPTTAPTSTCNIPAFDIPWVSTPPEGENFGPLPFDPDADYAMTIHADFQIPAIPPGGCSPLAIEALFNTALGLPGPGSALLELVRGTPPTPPPTPAGGGAPTAPAAASPAAAVTTTPGFTG